MGGKTKQSQRTKNNARPSSSGRSALLLNNVNLESGVMNIQGTELPALFPSLAAPNIDPLVSPELQLSLKKLNKKDPITKTKALQELSEVVSNSKVDDVVAALPSWAHFYKALTMDPDRKVREAVQSCHGAMMAACGRRVAPHLRQLVPTWLQAQHDEHAPAQALAQHSLAKTFPDTKLPEVISFCKSEVMAHLLDNLIGDCEAARVAKTDSPEEAAARAASGALRGLQQLAAGLPPAHHAWLRAALDPLLQHAGFWRRAEHKHPRVRAAWYAAVGQIIQRFGAEYAESYGRKTLRILVGIEETNPLAAAQFWDCLLLFMFNVEEWHQYVDRKELLVKRIVDVLENGGWGDARHLSNMLLPLLAHMPPDMLGKEFYITFFNAIFNGLDKKAILSSKSERQSWITTLDECLRYLSIQQQDYILEIVTSVHRTWLENILSDKHDGPVRTNLIKYSASSMAALVKYWLKQAKETNCEKYDQLIRNFWQNVGSTIATRIDKLSNDRAEIGKSIDGHILLLQTFKTSLMQDAKRQQSIKFDGDSPNVVEKPQKVTPPCDASIVERYNHNLFELVEKICGHYFGFASEREISSPVLAPVITLLVDFDSSKLYTAIARQFHCECAYNLYDRVFRSWLAGDTMRCKALVDIVFLLMKYLSEEEQDALFDSFKQFPPAVVETCLSLCVSHPHWARAAARRWVRGPLAAAALQTLCARVVEHGDVAGRDLLLLCLSHDAAGELMVSRAAARAVLERVAAALGAAPGPHVELLGGLGARLAAALTEPALAALVLGLFRLSVQVPFGSHRRTGPASPRSPRGRRRRRGHGGAADGAHGARGVAVPVPGAAARGGGGAVAARAGAGGGGRGRRAAARAAPAAGARRAELSAGRARAGPRAGRARRAHVRRALRVPRHLPAHRAAAPPGRGPRRHLVRPPARGRLLRRRVLQALPRLHGAPRLGRGLRFLGALQARGAQQGQAGGAGAGRGRRVRRRHPRARAAGARAPRRRRGRAVGPRRQVLRAARRAAGRGEPAGHWN